MATSNLRLTLLQMAETALGQWLHDFGSTNELSQRSRIILDLIRQDETSESQVMLYELLASARAELPDPDFVPNEDREIRLRSLRDRIDAYLSVTDYMKLRSAVEPTPLREPTAFQDFVASLPEKASARPIPPGRMCNTHGNWNCSECCPPENGEPEHG